MPDNKDFKRLVRERKAKDGISYTAARESFRPPETVPPSDRAVDSARYDDGMSADDRPPAGLPSAAQPLAVPAVDHSLPWGTPPAEVVEASPLQGMSSETACVMRELAEHAGGQVEAWLRLFAPPAFGLPGWRKAPDSVDEVVPLSPTEDETVWRIIDISGEADPRTAKRRAATKELALSASHRVRAWFTLYDPPLMGSEAVPLSWGAARAAAGCTPADEEEISAILSQAGQAGRTEESDRLWDATQKALRALAEAASPKVRAFYALYDPKLMGVDEKPRSFEAAFEAAGCTEADKQEIFAVRAEAVRIGDDASR